MELDIYSLVAVSRPCIRFFSFRYRFQAVTEWSLILTVLVAVSRPCIRLFSFRYHFKAVTELSLIFIVLVPVSRPCIRFGCCFSTLY